MAISEKQRIFYIGEAYKLKVRRTWENKRKKWNSIKEQTISYPISWTNLIKLA